MTPNRLLLSAGPKGFRSGLPLGGLGTGKIELLPSGRFNRLTIQNNWSSPLINNHKVNSMEDPGLLGFHFAIRVKTGTRTIVRLLESTRSHGLSRTAGWKTVSRVVYEGRFPLAVLRYEDKGLPVEVKLTAYSPVIPHDYASSSWPGCLFDFEIRNPRNAVVEVSLLVVGRNLSGAYAIGRRNRLENSGSQTLIHFENTEADPRESEAGSMTIGIQKRPGHEISYIGQWNLQKEHFRMDRLINLDSLKTWQNSGHLPNTPAGITVRGGSVNWGAALADSLRVNAGERKTVSIALSWHFPRAPEGHIYEKYFSHSGQACRTLMKSRSAIRRSIENWHGVIAEASLPFWLKKALPNNLYPLVSASRWARDGRFWLYEAPIICPYLGTLDVRFYGSLPLALMFPELDKRELLEFVRAQRPDGYIPHDLGWAKPHSPGDGTTPFLWKDLCPKFALMAYRTFSWTGDRRFLRDVYPAVKKALAWAIRSDADGDGLPDHEGADQTFDLWAFRGASSYVSGIFLASLLAGERLANLMNDSKSARLYREAFSRGQTSFIQKLWSGRYFIAWRQGKISSGACTAGQLTGQWIADQLGLGDIIPPKYTQKAIESMLHLNAGSSRFGAVNSVFPSKKIDESNRHARNIFAGVSYALAALAIQRGHISEGLALAEKTWKNISEIQVNPWNQADMISSSTGRYLFGDSYMRNMVIWAIPFALAKRNPSVARMLKRLGAPGGVKPIL